MTKPRTKVYFGKVCAKHPELKGERHVSRNCTKCARERKRAYREKNKEKFAEYQRTYREKNREKVAKRERAWYSSLTPEQREIRLARMRAYNLERAYCA